MTAFDDEKPTCSTCDDTKFVPWSPGQQRFTDEDEQPCPDCTLPQKAQPIRGGLS